MNKILADYNFDTAFLIDLLSTMATENSANRQKILENIISQNESTNGQIFRVVHNMKSAAVLLDLIDESNELETIENTFKANRRFSKKYRDQLQNILTIGSVIDREIRGLLAKLEQDPN